MEKFSKLISFGGEMTKIKICGITKPEEAIYLKKNNVDFAGIVMFYDKSKRSISVDRATEIVNEFKRLNEEEKNINSTTIKTVAVMVSPTIEQMKLAEGCGFDFMQIHGELTDEMINISGIPLLKAFNVSDMEKYDHYCSFDKIKGFVFDAGEPGSGKVFDWDMLKTLERYEDKLFILAGGLSVTNVKNAINTVNPDGVDVSSAVEICKEKPDKDVAKIDEFVMCVREAN